MDVKFEYSADGTNYSTTRPAGLEALSKSGTTGVERTVTARAGAHEEIESTDFIDDVVTHARIMAARSSVSNYDLSTHDILGNERKDESGKVQIVTSNCYVVTAPGTYRFPMVYGNSIDGVKYPNLVYNAAASSGSGRVSTAMEVGGGNVKAYKYTGSHANLTKFLRFDGQEITMPSILNDLGGLSYSDCEPVVVWQDVPKGEEIIKDDPFFQSSSTNWPLPIGYIHFKIEPTTITEDPAKPNHYIVTGARQGNIVIALRLKAAKTIGGTSYPKGTIL